MKISNETKVGVLTIVAVTLLVLGYNFLKGKEVFSKTKTIYAVFSDLGALEKSNQVKINGLPVGIVYDLNAMDKEVSGIVVTINLTRDVNIPDNSQAYISTPLVGGSFIIIERGNSEVYMKSGDTLKTRTDSGLLDDVRSQFNPTLIKVRDALDSLKFLLGNINRLFNTEANNNLQQTFSNLNAATDHLKYLLNTETGPFANSIKNVNSITENLKKNNDSITATISNAKMLTRKWSTIDLQKTVDSLDAAIAFLKSSIAKITSNDGTLGSLISDKELYNKLKETILSAELLLDDIRTHPKRYVNFSIFGRKDKDGPLTSPLKKDTLSSPDN